MRDLNRMGQSGSVQVAFMIDENLGLVHEPPKPGGMNDAIAIALKFISIRCQRFLIATPAAGFHGSGIRCKLAGVH